MEITATTTAGDVIKAAREQSIKDGEAAKAAQIASEQKAEKAKADALASSQATAKAAVEKSATATTTEAAKGTYAFKALAVDDFGVIIGIGAVAGNVDGDKETLEQKGMIEMSYDFCGSAGRVLKANHGDAMEKAELVSSWPGAPVLKSGKILTATDPIPTDDPIVSINIEKGKETHWFVGIRPNDEAVVKAAREGGIAGFSWGAHVVKTPVTA